MIESAMLRKLSISAAATLLMLLLCELALRFAGFMPEYNLKLKTIESDAGRLHIVLDTRRLYRVKPHSREDINNYGYRDDDFSPAKDRPRVLLLGDSFIMGNNLDLSQTVPKQLQRLMRVDVYNMGVSGYGPEQSLIGLLDEGVALNPDAVVLALFAGNDLRDLELDGLVELDDAGGLRRRRSNLITETLPLTRLQVLLRMGLQQRYLPPEAEKRISAAFIEDKEELLSDPPSVRDARRLALMKALLGEYQRELGERRLPFFVLIIPGWTAMENFRRDGDRSFRTERALARLCDELGLEYFDLTDSFISEGGLDLYDPQYRHLNVQGANTAAVFLADELQLTYPQIFGKRGAAGGIGRPARSR